MLVEGVIALIAVVLITLVYLLNVNDAKSLAYCRLSMTEQLADIYNRRFAFIVLSPAFIACIAFIILPIVITVLVSFTNYSAPNHIPPRNLVDWVGFKNFFLPYLSCVSGPILSLVLHAGQCCGRYLRPFVPVDLVLFLR